MKKFLNHILCFFSIHKWQQNRKFHAADYAPTHSIHETPERECLNCGKKQKWVLGKGDGEMGHWEKV